MPIDFNKIAPASSGYFGGVKSSPLAATTTIHRQQKYGIDFNEIKASKTPLITYTYTEPKPVELPPNA